jgi:DNA-binding NarL/FixJ family response regulator
MRQNPIRVFLVDDHKMLREGLRSLLESELDIIVVGEAGTEREAIRFVERVRPDVIIMDLGLPGGSGLNAIKEIKRAKSEIKIIVLSMQNRREVVFKALQAGSDGYVPKSSAHASLVEAIRTVHHGDRFLHPKAVNALVEELTDPHK